MIKAADMAAAARPISQAHGVKRIAQLTTALKNRVQKSTPHLKSLPAGERFRAFAMENPGVAERAKATAKRFASTSGLKTAGFHRHLVKNAISLGLARRVNDARSAAMGAARGAIKASGGSAKASAGHMATHAQAMVKSQRSSQLTEHLMQGTRKGPRWKPAVPSAFSDRLGSKMRGKPLGA